MYVRKNIIVKKIGLIMSLCLIIGLIMQNGLIHVHGKSIGGSSTAYVGPVKYVLNHNYVDQDGNTIAESTTVGPLTFDRVQSRVYPLSIKEISHYKYEGHSYEYVTSGRQSGFITNENTIDLTLSTVMQDEIDNGWVTIDVDVVYSEQNATIQYNKNAAGAVGNMPSQQVHLNETVNLMENQFVYPEHVFLGWSTTPYGEVEYKDKETITTEKNITLYAIWGKPNFAGSVITDKTTAEVNDIVRFAVRLTNQDTGLTTPLYNTVLTIGFTEKMGYVEDSLKIYYNGYPISVGNYYDSVNNKLVIPLGTMQPSDQYSVQFSAKALKTGSTQLPISAVFDNTETGTPRSSNQIGFNIMSDSIFIK